MTNYAKKSILVVDNGLFLHFAESLTEYFGTIYYWSPWVQAFSKSNQLMTGQGIPGVTRVRTIEEVIDDVDLFVFLDVGYGQLQSYLVKQGKRVWGPRLGEELELDRLWAKEKATELGISIGPYSVVRGIDDLREYLRDNPDQYVKVSALRGDAETFHSPDYDTVEPRLDKLEWVLGIKKNWTEFIVEAAIHDAIEIGYDGYTIDGKFPKTALFGIEVKDKGYLGEVVPYLDIPSSLIDVNKKLSPYLKKEKYRGMFSCEQRVRGDDYFFIDPCCRMPSPPGELYGVLISNWADILWEGADGELIEPEFTSKFGACMVLISEWARDNWMSVSYPDSIADFVRLKNYAIIDDRRYVIPQLVCPIAEFAVVVGVGNTPDEAIRKVQRNAEQVEGLGIDYFPSALDDAVEQFAELKDEDNG